MEENDNKVKYTEENIHRALNLGNVNKAITGKF